MPHCLLWQPLLLQGTDSGLLCPTDVIVAVAGYGQLCPPVEAVVGVAGYGLLCPPVDAVNGVAGYGLLCPPLMLLLVLQGTDYCAHLLKFMCLGSDAGGINRRPVRVVFTLEEGNKVQSIS